MKVGIIATSGIYPIEIGGPANVGYFLAKGLIKEKCEVILFVRVMNRKQLLQIQNNQEFKINNIKIIPIMINYDKNLFLNFPQILFKIILLTKMIVHEKVDIIFYNSPPIDITLLSPLCYKIMGVKQVLIFHGYGGIYDSKNLFHRFGRFLVKLQRNFFDRVIVSSKYSLVIPEHFGFKKSIIKIIPNGIDIDIEKNIKYIQLTGSPKILFVGRLVKIKGIEQILQAFGIFIKKYPLSRLYIIGEGPERENLEQLSKELGIFDYIKFEGFVNPPEVYQYYKSCDLFILTSYQESFPITILEAMLFKIPIIATNINGGPKDLIKNGENGFLFEVGNYKQLSELMIYSFENEELIKNFAQLNYSLVQQHYDWKIISSNYAILFNELVLKNI